MDFYSNGLLVLKDFHLLSRKVYMWNTVSTIPFTTAKSIKLIIIIIYFLQSLVENVVINKQNNSLSSPMPHHTNSGLTFESINNTEHERPGKETNALVCFIRYLLIRSFVHSFQLHLQIGDLKGREVPFDSEPGVCSEFAEGNAFALCCISCARSAPHRGQTTKGGSGWRRKGEQDPALLKQGTNRLLCTSRVGRSIQSTPPLPPSSPAQTKLEEVCSVFWQVSGHLQCWEVLFPRDCAAFHVLHLAGPVLCWQGASSSSERRGQQGPAAWLGKTSQAAKKSEIPCCCFWCCYPWAYLLHISSKLLAPIPITVKQEIVVLGIRTKWSAPLCPHQNPFPPSSASVTQHSLLHSQSLRGSEGL